MKNKITAYRILINIFGYQFLKNSYTKEELRCMALGCYIGYSKGNIDGYGEPRSF